tara:strand:- start:100 stop:312 length:213 start_codon:yes stop_codon:yes gene_type:complete
LAFAIAASAAASASAAAFAAFSASLDALRDFLESCFWDSLSAFGASFYFRIFFVVRHQFFTKIARILRLL